MGSGLHEMEEGTKSEKEVVFKSGKKNCSHSHRPSIPSINVLRESQFVTNAYNLSGAYLLEQGTIRTNRSYTRDNRGYVLCS